MQDKFAMIHTEEEYKEYVRKALEESEREAADPNMRWITWEEFREAVEAKLYELGCYSSAKSA